MRTIYTIALLTSLAAVGAQAGEILPAPGQYVSADGACMSVVSQDVELREFTLSSQDVCKPGLNSAGSEERSFRCVANINGSFLGYWGSLKGGGFIIRGDSVYSLNVDNSPRTVQQTSFASAMTFVKDTTGICGTVRQPADRLR